ncbi:MAG: hypothetical protein QOH31_3450 [Verrucomicrobiota bacterium]
MAASVAADRISNEGPGEIHLINGLIHPLHITAALVFAHSSLLETGRRSQVLGIPEACHRILAGCQIKMHP